MEAFYRWHSFRGWKGGSLHKYKARSSCWGVSCTWIQHFAIWFTVVFSGQFQIAPTLQIRRIFNVFRSFLHTICTHLHEHMKLQAQQNQCQTTEAKQGRASNASPSQPMPKQRIEAKLIPLWMPQFNYLLSKEVLAQEMNDRKGFSTEH